MVKTNKPCTFAISFELCTLFQKLAQKVIKKKNLEYESILYNSIQLSVDWSYNPEVIASVSYMFLAKQLTSKGTYFLKSTPEVEDSLCYFL